MASEGQADVPLQHPLALLSHTLKASDGFADLFAKVVGLSGGTLNLICYGDEITPGQALASVSKRKTLGLYGSFADSGFTLLSNDTLWFTLTHIDAH